MLVKNKFKLIPRSIMKSLVILLVLFMSTTVFSFDGGKYFKQNCKSCHTVGGGDSVGPDLAELHTRRKIDWVVKFVSYPEGMIDGDDEEPGYEKADALAKKVAKAYKPTIMPEFSVDKKKVQAIFDYLKSTGKKAKGKITKIK
jgi:cytochrome c2